ncbi:MAG: Cation-transporting P-type ATPase [Bacteroidota bacterium]
MSYLLLKGQYTFDDMEEERPKNTKTPCYHCGEDCGNSPIRYDEKDFCCTGCKTVYALFQDNNLADYYDIESAAGASPKAISGQYDYLENPEIEEKLIQFKEEDLAIVSFYIPHIHCSSCIWLLENLHNLQPNILSTQVDFPQKKVRIHYQPQKISLKDLVVLLTAIGYEPYISLADLGKKEENPNRKLWIQLGVAGFSFGNVMFLSFPEYFESQEFWLDQYKSFFRLLMFLFSLPVVLYAGSDYFISAYKGIKARYLNIDVPIALGITVLFLRSSFEVFQDLGSGYFDSLTGLVFFLLLGRYFQKKTYDHLSFERDYSAYFPIAVTCINEDGEESMKPIYRLEVGDRMLLRHQEIIPADGYIVQGTAQIDYSYVTGESKPTPRVVGEKVLAGGRQMGSTLEVVVHKTVDQSYLTQLWSQSVFAEKDPRGFQNFTDALSKRFTLWVLAIALGTGAFWLWADPTIALNAVTAVLIIACPCALALAAPFTLGHLIRRLGKAQCYVKEANSLEQMARINHVVFDKTGTLTQSEKTEINYLGNALEKEHIPLIKNTLRASNHPLSRRLYAHLPETLTFNPAQFIDHPAQGIEAWFGKNHIRLGSAHWLAPQQAPNSQTAVLVEIDGVLWGQYLFTTQVRPGVAELFQRLGNSYQLSVLSGDQDSDRALLEKLVPPGTPLLFHQKPQDKLDYIKSLQDRGARVMMVGDGLNDAGALAQAQVGVAITEQVAVFTPASDVIIQADLLAQLDRILALSKSGMRVIRQSLLLSLTYNTIGLSFAVSGHLIPVVAAILMPISAISVVIWTSTATTYLAEKKFKSLFQR